MPINFIFYKISTGEELEPSHFPIEKRIIISSKILPEDNRIDIFLPSQFRFVDIVIIYILIYNFTEIQIKIKLRCIYFYIIELFSVIE